MPKKITSGSITTKRGTYKGRSGKSSKKTTATVKRTISEEEMDNFVHRTKTTDQIKILENNVTLLEKELEEKMNEELSDIFSYASGYSVVNIDYSTIEDGDKVFAWYLLTITGMTENELKKTVKHIEKTHNIKGSVHTYKSNNKTTDNLKFQVEIKDKNMIKTALTYRNADTYYENYRHLGTSVYSAESDIEDSLEEIKRSKKRLKNVIKQRYENYNKLLKLLK